MWQEPLATSLRGLWVSGTPVTVQWWNEQKGGVPKTDQVRERGLTQNSRVGIPKRLRPITAETRPKRGTLETAWVAFHSAQWRGSPKNPVCEREGTSRTSRSVLSRTQAAGRRDATQSPSLRPACRHLGPPEVGPLRVIHGHPTYTSELECSETVMSGFDTFVS